MGERKGTKALELWCRRLTEGYPGVKIDNMTTSWRDGLAFCAMIHHFRPDLIDFDKLNKEDIYYNNDLAFRTAERHLGIPALLDAVDMASYEVPDRLSILTYLAQFYQVFAAQDSPNRTNNKRPSNVVEKNSITKPAGPPPKMAHIVGVPKREPCQKCSMPVFLAERLTVGKKVYHRTCLKCARCSTQLTPGSFYETEIDGEYCCETCPDEERSISPHKRLDDENFSIPSTVSSSKTTSSNRLSSKIADRLAFFENANRNNDDENTSKRLLQKSLSDEEKSQSLKKFQEDQKNVYQTNTEFNKFLNNHFSDVTDLASGASGNDVNAINRESLDILRRDSATSVITTTSDSDGNSDEETTDDQHEEQNKEDLPPDLPKSLPPYSSINDDNISGKQIKMTDTVSFNSVQLENKLDDTDTGNNRTPSITSSSKNVTDDENVIDDRNIEQKFEQNQISVINEFSNSSCHTEIRIHDNNDLKNSFNVAKDSFDDDDNDADDYNKEDLIKNENKMRTFITPEYLADIDSNTTANNNELNISKEAEDVVEVYNNNDKMSNLSSMVRTRLNQFENCIANNNNNKISSENTIVNDKYAKNEIISNSVSTNNNDSIKEISCSINNKNDKDQFQMSIINEKQNENKSVDNDDDENEVPKNVSIINVKNNENNSSRSDDDDHKMITNIQNEKDKNASFHNQDITLTELECKNDKMMIENHQEQQQQQQQKDEKQEISMGIINTISECDNHNVKEIKQQIVLSKKNKQIKDNGDDDDDDDDDKKQQYYSSALNDDVELNATTAVTNKQITTQKNVTVVRDDDINDDSDHMHKDSIQDDDKNKENTKIFRKNAVSSVSSSSEKSATLRKITLSPELNSNLASSKMRTGTSTLKLDEYPEELNPFKSDEEDDEENDEKIASATNSNKEKRKSLNPFESDDEDNLNEGSVGIKNEKVKPPRPPPPKKISTNPFGSESEGEDDASQTNSSSGTSSKRTPVPTPRNHLSKSQNPTPEPTPRITRQCHGSSLKNSEDYYNSNMSLSPINIGTKLINNEQFVRDENCRGSTHSLTSSGSGTGTKRKTKKAPAPPPPPNVLKSAKELFPTSETDSKKSSPSSSNAASPKFRKKRPAPAPPSINLKVDSSPISSTQQSMSIEELSKDSETSTNQAITEAKLPNLNKLSDEEKVLLENNTTSITTDLSIEQPSINYETSNTSVAKSETTSKRRLIALDASLIEDSNSSQDLKLKEEENVVYRRKIIPPAIDSFLKDKNDTVSTSINIESEESHDRQLEKLKDNKEAKNRNRQSHVSLHTDDNDPLLNKSMQGKWKRRKGPAPALPVPPRKVLQMLPLQEIRHELEVIEVQQQGLEKQGVMLEKMIRDRCEGQNSEDNNNSGVNSKEVEDLILQLFELVNEKNELFRRQAELMYLRRQHRLEQEQADLEYEIRVLMAQPERNKTDSDKAREESLIARLVEVVQLRNEVIECLEMDRLREAEEDMSIKQRLEMHTAKRDEELSKQTPTKLSKKEKKKQKELKKLVKSKKLDADKDADESEINNEKLKTKKKKKKFLF